MKHPSSSALLLAAAAASLVCPTAFGDTLAISGVDNTRGGIVSFNSDGSDTMMFAGVILGTYSGLSVSPLFCVDLYTGIKLGTYASVPVDPRTGRNEDRVAWLYVNQFATVTSATAGRALQLAIWDIVHDGGDGIASGRIQSNAFTPLNVVSAWQDYLTVSSGQSLLTGATIYLNTTLDTGVAAQAMIGAKANIPEPSLLSLAGIAGLAAFLMRRSVLSGQSS